MRNTYDYNHIVPIPEGAHICKDKRIYIILKKVYYPELKYNMDEKLWVGKYSSEGKMFPSTDYAEHFPNEYRSAAPDLFCKEDFKRIGIFGCALSIGLSTGIYPILISSFGIENANLLMDYSVSMILNHSNVVTTLEVDLKDRVNFLNKAYSDSWIGEKLNAITYGQERLFFDAWLDKCVENGIVEVWVCMDGCNSDYLGQNTDLGEKGKAKSGKNRNIVGYMYAVAEDGTPIYGKMYNGGQVDSKEFIEFITILREHKVKVKGIILDRGFCDITCFRLLDDYNYTYVIMLKENTVAYKHMIELYATKLKLSWEHAFGDGHYGVAEQTQVFAKYEKLSNVALIWDSQNGVERSESLIDKARKVIDELTAKLCDIEKPSVPKEFSKLITIEPVAATEKSSSNPTQSLGSEADSSADIKEEVNNEHINTGPEASTSDHALTGENSKTPTLSEKKDDSGDKSNKEEPVSSINIGEQIPASCPDANTEVAAETEKPISEEATTAPANASLVSSNADEKTPEKGLVVHWKIVVNVEELQKKIDTKGFYALASSDMSLNAQKMDKIYNIRDVSEKQNSRIKTQEGADAPRGHSDKNIKTRFVASFSGSCIRKQFEDACERSGLDVNKAIREMDHVVASLGARNTYRVIHNRTENQHKFMHEVGLEDSDFDYLAAKLDERYESKEHVTIHNLPKYEKKEAEESSSANSPTIRVEGIPSNSVAKGKGSKKIATQEECVSEASTEVKEEPSVKRGRGRPKGRKNRPKTENTNTPKRGRGRPKGSKNKPKEEHK